MKPLREHVLFGADQLQTIKAVFNRSTISKINYENDNEKNLVQKIVKVAHQSPDKDSSVYVTLKAAIHGPDTTGNYLLLYIMNLSASLIVDKYAEEVDKVLDYLNSGVINHPKDKVDAYLTNPNLYSRSPSDFEYTLRAFDAVIYKKEKYFDIDSSGQILTAFSSLKQAYKFFGKGIKDNTFKDNAHGEKYAGRTINAFTNVDQRYFFTNLKVSKTAEIIPAGIGGASPDSRTIWNYMELWTDSVGRDDSSNNQEANSRRRRLQVQDAKTAAKKIIKDANFKDKDAENALVKIIDTYLT